MRSLLLLISLFICSCGLRKTELEKSKNKYSLEQADFKETKLDSDVNTNVAFSSFANIWDNSTLKNSNAEIEVNETFDKDGRVTGRTTKAKFNKSEQSSSKGSSLKTDSAAAAHEKTKKSEIEDSKLDIDISSSAKKKLTDANNTVAANAGGAGWLYVTAISLSVLVLLYFLFKNKIITLRKPVKK